MAIGQKRGHQFIPEEESFDLWNTLGSISKVERNYQSRGVANPNGKPFSRRGIEMAAKRWMLRNEEEARKRIISAGGKWANSAVLWYAHLWKISKSALSIHEYRVFINYLDEVYGNFSDEEKKEFWLIIGGDEEEI